MPYRLMASILVLWGAMVNAAPPEAVAAASAHVRRLPPEQARGTRYFDLSNVPAQLGNGDEEDVNHRAQLVKVLSFWANSLSTEAKLRPLTKVTDSLYCINVYDYGPSFVKTWERLAEFDPYFHQQTLITTQKLEWYGTPPDYKDRFQKATGEIVTVKKAASAQWLPTADIVNLIALTGSEVPIVRGDWFIWQTGQQADRGVAGYYDFLGLGKQEADFFNLVGADVKLAQRLKKEQAAIVRKSKVTRNNRSMYRLQTVTGELWFTQDFKTSTDRQNTLRLLDGDLQPPNGDASEMYSTLPNGLFAFWLQNGKGERQDSAPDFIAGDSKSTHDGDNRVHIGISCVRCHLPGIQNIRDWARETYRDDVKLGSPDPDRLRRLEQLYLSDLDKSIKRDQGDYADALLEVNGLKSADNATTFAEAFRQYDAEDVDLETAAVELGTTALAFRAALRNYAGKQPIDPLLTALAKERSIPMRREHWQELYGIAATIVRPQLVKGATK